MKRLLFLTELMLAPISILGMVNENQKEENVYLRELTKKEITEQLWDAIQQENKNIKKIKELIDLGADFNDFKSWDNGENGKTPFIWVIEEGYPEIVEYMIQKYAKDNEQDPFKIINEPAQYGDRDLPIMLAAIGEGNTDLVNLFLKYGADVSKTNNKGKTLIMYAAQYRNLNILRILIGEDDCEPIISQLLTRKKTNTLNNKLKNRLLINETDSNGMTALMFALQNGCPEDNTDTVKFLIEKGAEINVQDKYGNTPVIIALQNDPKYETIEYLIKKGANTNAKNKFGSTPLSTTKARLNDWKPWETEDQTTARKEEIERIIQLLKEYGAK